MKIEASVLLGDRDEEVEVYGEPDCWDFGRGRLLMVYALTWTSDGLCGRVTVVRFRPRLPFPP